jgi:predicted nucleic acid-binding protein
MTAARVFLDTSVIVRYLAEDDIPRALAASNLIDGPSDLVVSTAVLVEAVHVLRTEHGISNPWLAEALIRFLDRVDVELVDADRIGALQGIRSTVGRSARRIPDALIAAAAGRARCDWIAAFDRDFRSATVPVRLI